MGNKLHCQNASVSTKEKLKAKFSRKKLKTNSDHFILEYSGSNQNIIKDLSLVDQRRVVFVSLIGLFTTWDDCPAFILHSAIFILPLKRRWIYNPTQYMSEIKNSFLYHYTPFYPDGVRLNKFIQLLQWKDSQGLIFWMLDDFSFKSIKYKINPLVQPFWYHVANKLTNLYDPIQKGYYKPLHFDVKWWGDNDNYVSLYDVPVSCIMKEYFLLSMNYKSIQEILHQSNPKSFNIVISYNKHNPTNNINRMIKTTSIQSIDCDDDDDADDADDADDDDDDEWYICDDYDPADV